MIFYCKEQLQQLLKQDCFSDESSDEVSDEVSNKILNGFSDEIWNELSITNVLRQEHA